MLDKIMVWKESIVISDDLVTSAYLIFGISRFCGLAPFSVKKQNKLLVIELSFFYTVYSVIILLGVGEFIFFLNKNPEITKRLAIRNIEVTIYAYLPELYYFI